MIGRRICKACHQEWVDEKIKQVTEERVARMAAAAAAGGGGR